MNHTFCLRNTNVDTGLIFGHRFR